MLPVATFIRLLCLLCTTLLLGSCSPYLSPRQNSRLVHEIIFSAERSASIQVDVDQGIIRYIDSNLIYRQYDLYGDTLNQYVNPAQIESLRLDKVSPMRLTIPPEWRDAYRYYQGNFEAVALQKKHSMAFISPLIPTKEKGVYVLQSLFYTITREDDISIGMWFVGIRRIIIKRGKIVDKGEIFYNFISAD